MSKILGPVFIVAMLLFMGNGLNWQGTGNMSQDNITAIRAYINGSFKASWASGTVAVNGADTQLVDFATGLSDQLNNLWKPAWNVVVVYIYPLNQNYDTVLYGYAFRDHWMWINGYKMNDGSYVSFVIWKDYNCILWQKFNQNTIIVDAYPNSYPENSTTVKSVISAYLTTLDRNDVWTAAKVYSDALTTSTTVKNDLGSDLAFSVVMSQSRSSRFYARFCAKHYLQNYDMVSLKVSGSTNAMWGHAFIMQMR